MAGQTYLDPMVGFIVTANVILARFYYSFKDYGRLSLVKFHVMMLASLEIGLLLEVKDSRRAQERIIGWYCHELD